MKNINIFKLALETKEIIKKAFPIDEIGRQNIGAMGDNGEGLIKCVVDIDRNQLSYRVGDTFFIDEISYTIFEATPLITGSNKFRFILGMKLNNLDE